jgi:hypothetical protein
MLGQYQPGHFAHDGMRRQLLVRPAVIQGMQRQVRRWDEPDGTPQVSLMGDCEKTRGYLVIDIPLQAVFELCSGQVFLFFAIHVIS